MFKYAYQQNIKINASDEAVYNILINFTAYEQWNPFVASIDKDAQVGDLVKVKAQLGRFSMPVYHRILAMQKNEVLHWEDSGWFTQLAYGQRIRTIKKIDEHSISLSNKLTVSGPLAWLVHLFSAKTLRNGMQAENQALKNRAELS